MIAASWSRDVPAEGRTERGQNLVEFALLMPFILLFLGAIIWFALAMHTRSNLQQAVREAARQAAVGQDLVTVQEAGAGNAPETLEPEEVKWCLPTGSSGHVGESIRVYIDEGNDGTEGYSYTLAPATGVFAFFGVSNVEVNMQPRATARLEKSMTGVPACAP